MKQIKLKRAKITPKGTTLFFGVSNKSRRLKQQKSKFRFFKKIDFKAV